ncbi:unnamed protein product [Caretta caretta]
MSCKLTKTFVSGRKFYNDFAALARKGKALGLGCGRNLYIEWPGRKESQTGNKKEQELSQEKDALKTCHCFLIHRSFTGAEIPLCKRAANSRGKVYYGQDTRQQHPVVDFTCIRPLG